MNYLFILGKNPTLSIAEIINFLKAHHFTFGILSLSKQTLVINIKKEKNLFNPQKIINQLGGTVKIAEVIEEITNKNSLTQLVKIITPTIFLKIKKAQDKKENQRIIFGLSFYGFSKIRPKFINQLGLEIKKELKQQGISSRFVALKKDSTLSSVIVDKEKLTTKGQEIIIAKTINIQTKKPIIYLAKTLTVQDYEKYNLRDYGRPHRNPKIGMIPPKLAQIMINLSLNQKSKIKNQKFTIYDPFCGYGTILQEALLMGYDILGSDINPKMIEATKNNLSWLIKKFKLSTIDYRLSTRLLVADATKLPHQLILRQLANQSFSIVTEGYLGPPLKHQPSEKEIKKISSQIIPLYHKALIQFYKILKPHQRLVIIFPYFPPSTIDYRISTSILDQIKKIGYHIICPLPPEILAFEFKQFYPELTTQMTIIYHRSDQFIGREIIVLEK